MKVLELKKIRHAVVKESVVKKIGRKQEIKNEGNLIFKISRNLGYHCEVMKQNILNVFIFYIPDTHQQDCLDSHYHATIQMEKRINATN